MKQDCRAACTTCPATVAAGLAVLVLVLTGANATAWDSDLDPTFSGDGRTIFSVTGTGRAHGVAIQSDGKIVVVGSTRTEGATPGTFHNDFSIARFDADGLLDPGFGVGGVLNLDVGASEFYDEARDVAVQHDGKIVVVGTMDNEHMVIVRLNADGSPDAAGAVPFSRTANGYGIALQPDGKIVVAGTVNNTVSGWDFAVARINTNMTIDTSFGSDGMVDWDFGDQDLDVAYDVEVRGDGKIVLAGAATWSGQRVFGTMVLSDTGGPQCLGWAEFSSGASGEGLALQSDGKAVVAGRIPYFGGGSDMAVARFNTNCTLDTTFSYDGMNVFSLGANQEATGRDVVVQHDGKIVVAGTLEVDGRTNLGLVRWTSDGSFSRAFNAAPLNSYTYFGLEADVAASGWAVARQPDGKLVIVGASGLIFEIYPGVARIQGDEDLVFTDGFESGDTAWWGDWGP